MEKQIKLQLELASKGASNEELNESKKILEKALREIEEKTHRRISYSSKNGDDLESIM